MAFAERCDEGRYARLSDASRRRAGLDDMDISLKRRLINPSDRIIEEVNPSDRIIEEVGRVDPAVGGGDLATAHHTGSKHGGTLELRPHQQRIDDQSSIDRRVDAWNTQFSLGTHY